MATLVDMGLFTAVGSVCAAAGLAVGGFGMASGPGGVMAAQHEGMQHMAMHSSDAGKTSAARVITKRELAQITPQGTLPVIRGTRDNRSPHQSQRDVSTRRPLQVRRRR